MMPYKSDKQRRYMHAKHPEIAARWDRETGGKVEKKGAAAKKAAAKKKLAQKPIAKKAAAMKKKRGY